jgi:hypothetical protein
MTAFHPLIGFVAQQPTPKGAPFYNAITTTIRRSMLKMDRHFLYKRMTLA